MRKEHTEARKGTIEKKVRLYRTQSEGCAEQAPVF